MGKIIQGKKCFYCKNSNLEVLNKPRGNAFKDKKVRAYRCKWCGAHMIYTDDDVNPQYIMTTIDPAQCFYMKEPVSNSIDNYIEEQKQKLEKPKGKLKFKKKISNKEEQDMKVKEIALQQNMPVETYTEEQGFIPTWQHEVLDEEARLNELAKEAAEKESALDWDKIMAGFGPITTKCEIQED